MGNDAGVVESLSGPLNEADDAKPDLDDEIRRGEHRQSVTLRNVYAFWIGFIVTAQVVAMNLFIFFQAVGSVPGYGLPFHLEDTTFRVFTVSVFASVVALGYIVTRSLFPGKGGGFWESILGIFSKKDAVP